MLSSKSHKGTWEIKTLNIIFAKGSETLDEIIKV